MLTKRISISAEVKQQPKSAKPHTSKTMKSASTVVSAPAEHYNDWPNAPGFDTTYEEYRPVELAIQGHIPAYTAGTLFRTGIGPRTVTKHDGKKVFKTNHWFDAFSQVHRFQLHAPTDMVNPNADIDKVTYNSRLTSDKIIARIQETGKSDDFTFAGKYDPCRSFFQKVQGMFQKMPDRAPNEINNAVTMSVNYPGLSPSGESQTSPYDASRIVTVCNKTDGARIQMLDPETLAPTGIAMQSKLHPDLKGDISAAHPETCPITGDVYNYNMDFSGQNATYRVFRSSASTGETSILATVNHPAAYLHSMFLTEHFLILCIWNSHYSKAGVSVLWSQNLLDAMYFNDSIPAAWFVIDRRCPLKEGGKGVVAKFESDPFFAFHSINAYEVSTSDESGNVVDLICDVTAYPNMDVLHYFYMDNLVSSNTKAHQSAIDIRNGRYDQIMSQFRRYKLPSVRLPTSTSSSTLSTPKETPKAILEVTNPDSSIELPTFNGSYNTKPYRYVYGILSPDGTKSTFVDGLVKHDLHTKTVTTWSVKGQTPGEAIFVARPEGTQEDDGVLLSVVLDGFSGKSYLLCLDASDMTEVGRAEVDGVVGFGFHGMWTANL